MDSLTVSLNGRGKTIPRGSTITDTLRIVRVDPSRSGIAVAVNDRVVRRPEWEACVLADGDRIDVIQATQGG
ncbi:MAG: sulfur carrier protein ThiS [Rhodothermia bacterium]